MKNKGFTTTGGGLAAFAAALFLLLLVGSARGEQPDCVGDRHYDGVACCPVVDPPATTTTTVPQTCEPQACPDPAPCPEVICTSSADGAVTNNYVTVNRCPDLPNYKPCRRKASGKLICPRPKAPRRVLVPEQAGS